MKFVIKGPLPGLNELIEAERRNRYLGAQLKKKCETVVMHAARQLGNVEFQEPVYMIYRWYEKDRRRDKDNIRGFEDHFYVDSKYPRVEVEILGADETDGV